MAEKLRLFVSATHDLEPARSAIGRAIADLPIQTGIEIRRTPAAGASYDDIFELIANVDRVYFLIGRDITAPCGAEWHLAWELERSILPLRQILPRRTLAAQEFMRNAFIHWGAFQTPVDLTRLVTLDVARILNHSTNRYGLSVTELHRLSQHVHSVRSAMPAEQLQELGGAEGGGVLLDTAHGHEMDDELLVEDT